MGSVAVRGFAPAIFFVLLGGILWGWIGATGRNPLSETLGKRVWMVYVLVGFASVFVAWQGRNTFLPFLGPTVFPCAALDDKVPEGANTSVRIQTRPGAKVLYWAAEPTDKALHTLKNWRSAYGSFANVGVTTADDAGKAELRVRGPPQSYTVPMKGALAPHIHYRICLADGGLAQVETTFVSSSAAEEFQIEDGVILPENTSPDYGQQILASSPVLDDAERMVGPSDEELLGVANDSVSNGPSESTVENFVQPTEESLASLRMNVLRDSEQLFDPFAFPEGDLVNGSDLDAAFAAPQKPPSSGRKRV